MLTITSSCYWIAACLCLSCRVRCDFLEGTVADILVPSVVKISICFLFYSWGCLWNRDYFQNPWRHFKWQLYSKVKQIYPYVSSCPQSTYYLQIFPSTIHNCHHGIVASHNGWHSLWLWDVWRCCLFTNTKISLFLQHTNYTIKLVTKYRFL